MAPGVGTASSAAERMVEEARGSVVEVASGRRGAGVIVGDVLLGTEDGPATFGGAGDISDALTRLGESVRLRILRGGEALVVSVDLRASGRAA